MYENASFKFQSKLLSIQHKCIHTYMVCLHAVPHTLILHTIKPNPQNVLLLKLVGGSTSVPNMFSMINAGAGRNVFLV